MKKNAKKDALLPKLTVKGSKKRCALVHVIRSSVLLCGLSLLVLSCATKDPYKDVDMAVEQNDYELGIDAIIQAQESKKPLYSENNAISLFLDKGILEHYAGRYADSSQDLQDAERMIEEAYTKSISADVASYIANDNTKEYAGEDFEDIYINVFNALNYYNDGNIEGALVEIRKLTESSGKLSLLAQKYEGKGPNAGEWVLEQLNSIGFSITPELPQGQSVNFSNSALARYLSALFYLGDGNTDGARIEFEQLAAAFAANPKIYNEANSANIMKSVEDVNNTPDGKARLNVIGFSGLSPVKEEGLFAQHFPFFQNDVFHDTQFRLPVFVKRPSLINRIEVVVAGGETFNLDLLEDMGAVIEETYNARFGNIFFKTYIRTLVKYAAADVAATITIEAAKNGNEWAQLGASAAVVASKVAIDASEGADIRMSRYFPDKAYIGGIDLDPGTYSITINFYSGAEIIASEEYNDVNVEAGKLNLIEGVSLK